MPLQVAVPEGIDKPTEDQRKSGERWFELEGQSVTLLQNGYHSQAGTQSSPPLPKLEKSTSQRRYSSKRDIWNAWGTKRLIYRRNIFYMFYFVLNMNGTWAILLRLPIRKHSMYSSYNKTQVYSNFLNRLLDKIANFN